MSISMRRLLAEQPFVVLQGAIRDRLERESPIPPDAHVGNASLVHDPRTRGFVEKVYRLYLDVACRYGLPVVMIPQTKFLNREQVAAYDPAMPDLMAEVMEHCRQVRASYGEFAGKIILGALTGCKNDAYKPEEALTEEESYRYHADHTRRLAAQQPDFLYITTMPSVPEAEGLCRLAAETGLEYLVSFVVRPTGCVLDGTPLEEAIRRIDAKTGENPPFCYCVNCVHPTVLDACLGHFKDRELLTRRLKGYIANPSDLSPEELDGIEELQTEEPERFAEEVTAMHQKYGLSLLGGCCGTDERHMEAIIRRLLELHPQAAR